MLPVVVLCYCCCISLEVNTEKYGDEGGWSLSRGRNAFDTSRMHQYVQKASLCYDPTRILYQVYHSLSVYLWLPFTAVHTWYDAYIYMLPATTKYDSSAYQYAPQYHTKCLECFSQSHCAACDRYVHTGEYRHDHRGVLSSMLYGVIRAGWQLGTSWAIGIGNRNELQKETNNQKRTWVQKTKENSRKNKLLRGTTWNRTNGDTKPYIFPIFY